MLPARCNSHAQTQSLPLREICRIGSLIVCTILAHDVTYSDLPVVTKHSYSTIDNFHVEFV
jgi:hypothetical protein